MGALRDCEAVVHSFWGQPTNTVTTLAFVIGGIVIIGATDRVWLGRAMIATGVGSFLFHGPMPVGAQEAHDVTLWFLVAVAVVSIARDWRATGEWRHLGGPLALLAIVAVIGRLGTAGGPLCRPESIWQPHGLWHVGAAAAVVWWAFRREASL